MLLLSASAQAYVGPGAGITLLSSLLGMLVTFLFVIGGLLLWPLRVLWRKLRRQQHHDDVSTELKEDKPLPETQDDSP